MSRFLLIIATFIFVVFAQHMAFGQQEPNTKKTLRTAYVVHPIKRTDMPVLKYQCSMSHHFIKLLEPGSNLVNICIWEDGVIAWEVKAPQRSNADTLWYQTTIPAKKVETAVREITENFAKYPAKNRPTWTSIILSMGANFSPYIAVHSSQHYESFGMEKSLIDFYKKNREVFQSGDEEAILKIFTAVRGGMSPGTISPNGKYIGPHPAYMFDFTGLVEWYRHKFPQAGLAEKGTDDYCNEELLKCVALYTADVEHLLFAEKKILDLLPPTKGLISKDLDAKGHDFVVEQEIKDGKVEFFYLPISNP